MTCWDHSERHDGVEPRLYWTGFGPSRRTVVLCRGCLAALSAIGLVFHEEHRADPARSDRGPVLGPIARRVHRMAA